MTILIEINNGQPIPLMWYIFILFFFKNISIRLENIAKILTTGPRLGITCYWLNLMMIIDIRHLGVSALQGVLPPLYSMRACLFPVKTYFRAALVSEFNLGLNSRTNALRT